MNFNPNLPILRTPNPVEPPLPVAERSSGSPAEEPSGSPPVPASVLWRRRILVLLFVFLCAVFGVSLVILPWGPLWSNNHLLIAYPALRAVVDNAFARGVCTGLGVLDIWIGFWEAVHYHESQQP